MDKLFLKLYNSKRAKVISICALVLIIAILSLVLFIKYFLSYSFVENQILKTTGLKVEFIEPSSKLNFRLNLNTKAKAINIYNSNKTVQFVSIINPQITFKPFDFIFKKAYFKNLNAQNINIKIKRNSNGTIDLLEAINKDISTFKNVISVNQLNSNIEEINLLFDDKYKIKNQIRLNLRNSNINISKRNKVFSLSQTGTIETNIENKKQIANLDLNINSKYPFNKLQKDDLKLNVSLLDINLFIFSDFFKKYVSKEIKNLNGYSNLSLKTNENNEQNLEISIINPTLKLNNNKAISPFKNDININSIFNINKNELDIKNLSVLSQNLDIYIDGKIKNYNSKKINSDLNIDIKNTQINNLIHFIPDNAIFYRPNGIPTLKKANFFGVANGKIAAKFFPIDIEGNLKVQNIHIPNYPKSYKQNDVNAIFMKDKVRIYTRVYTPENEYVTVNGISNLDNSLYGQYSVKSTSKIDLAFAQKYLVPIQQIIGFNIGPVPIMKMSGYGNIDINTKGTIYDAQIFGNFKAYNATAEIEGLDAKLTNGSCELIFKDKELIFNKIKGKFDGADFILSGKGNTKGEVDFDVKINGAKTNSILKTFNNSQISKPYSSLTKQIIAALGDFDGNINLKGTILDYEDEKFLNSLFLSGNMYLKNNEIVLKNGLKIEKISGFLNFGKIQKGIFNFNIKNTQFAFKFNSQDSISKISKGEYFNINSEILSNKIYFSDIVSALQNSNIPNENIKKILPNLENTNFFSKINLNSQGKISLKNIDLNNFKHNGYLIGLNSVLTPNVKFKSGMIKLNGTKLNFDDLDMDILNGKIKAKGNIYNFLSKEPQGDLFVFLENISLDKLDKLNSNIKAKNGIIKKGVIAFKNNNLKLHSLSIDYADMPIFISANLKDIYTNKIIDANFSTLINENSADNIINPYLVSPFKISGELPIKGSLKGNNNNYSIDFNAIIPKDSDISYSGANLGDINHKRELEGKIDVLDNIAKIHNLKLIKYISNQNNKINPLVALRADGKLIKKNNSIYYDNLKIISNTPINVRILNLIFKKSLLKNGNFDCNITLNDDIKLPKINGQINLYDLGIPLYNTQIHNIKVSISNNFIDSNILASNNESDVKLRLHALNKLDAPYIIKDFILSSNNLNINDILSNISLNTSKTDITPKNELNFKKEDIIVEKGSFDFKDVRYNKINAQNLKGNLTYKNGLINLNNVNLNIAQGEIEADGNYNLKTTKLNLNAKMKDCNSNTLVEEFLFLPNQIFGKINGSIVLSAKNLNTPQGINSVKSEIDFSINNGKMPKLGSMEYLLRTGNLIKNGLMGLSLNNIIEVLTPYKTGEFEKISGNLIINNAEIEKLNIISQGKNLSLYLDGNYSILENFADIKIYGKLSQNISNALGALGNASINQFVDTISQQKRNKNEKNSKLQEKLDKIPSIESENPKPKFFEARVLGDINKDNYIKSFNWL